MFKEATNGVSDGFTTTLHFRNENTRKGKSSLVYLDYYVHLDRTKKGVIMCNICKCNIIII